MLISTKISLAIFLLIMITTIAKIFGKLDSIYVIYIAVAGISIQILMIAINLVLVLNRRKILKNGVKIVRYRIEDKNIKGDTDILPEFITTTNPIRPSIFTIYIEAKDIITPPEFGIYKKGKENPGKISDLKKHLSNISASIRDNLFIFYADIIVRPDETINFKFKQDVNIKIFFIGELYMT